MLPACQHAPLRGEQARVAECAVAPHQRSQCLFEGLALCQHHRSGELGRRGFGAESSDQLFAVVAVFALGYQENDQCQGDQADDQDQAVDPGGDTHG